MGLDDETFGSRSEANPGFPGEGRVTGISSHDGRGRVSVGTETVNSKIGFGKGKGRTW